VEVPCQIGPEDHTAEWAWLRDRMRRTVKMVENSGIAVFYDHGPNVHPVNKQVAGVRLAILALAKDHGRT
jgi:sialate O-acetylesterase